MLHRETSAYTTAYWTPAVYFYVTAFSNMYHWNTIRNTNTHHILQYVYYMVINNIYIYIYIYTKKSVSLKPICLVTVYGRPVCNRK